MPPAVHCVLARRTLVARSMGISLRPLAHQAQRPADNEPNRFGYPAAQVRGACLSTINIISAAAAAMRFIWLWQVLSVCLPQRRRYRLVLVRVCICRRRLNGIPRGAQ